MDPFEQCLRNGRLKTIAETNGEVGHELSSSIQELERARASFGEQKYERALIQSYFALYRGARTLLLAAGYKETNLYSLLTGLRHLYVTPGQVQGHLIDILSIAKEQKDLVQDGARCNPRDTEIILQSAESMIRRACELVDSPDLPPGHAGRDRS